MVLIVQKFIQVEFVISFEQTYHKVREAYQMWHMTYQKTKCLIHGLQIMCCKRNTCLFPWSMIFSLKLRGLFGDKGESTRQLALRNIMNIGIHVILEILLDSFGIGKKISKSGRVFIWKLRFFRLYYQEEEDQHQIRKV